MRDDKGTKPAIPGSNNKGGSNYLLFEKTWEIGIIKESEGRVNSATRVRQTNRSLTGGPVGYTCPRRKEELAVFSYDGGILSRKRTKKATMTGRTKNSELSRKMVGHR